MTQAQNLRNDFKVIDYVDVLSGNYVYTPNYECNSQGFVRNVRTNKIIKGGITEKGYTRVNLCDSDGNRFWCRVHRIVAHLFLPTDNLGACLFVDHIIPIAQGGSNDVSNLRFVDAKGNANNPLNSSHKHIPVVAVSRDGVKEYKNASLASRDLGLADITVRSKVKDNAKNNLSEVNKCKGIVLFTVDDYKEKLDNPFSHLAREFVNKLRESNDEVYLLIMENPHLKEIYFEAIRKVIESFLNLYDEGDDFKEFVNLHFNVMRLRVGSWLEILLDNEVRE